MALLATAALLMAPEPLHSRARCVRIGACRASRLSRLRMGGSSLDDEPNTDWDRAWQRYQLEGQDAPTQSFGTVADALANVASAEAAKESARLDVQAAAEEKQKLEDELRFLEDQKVKSKLFDGGDSGDALTLGLAVLGGYSLLNLLHWLRVHGLEDVPPY